VTAEWREIRFRDVTGAHGLFSDGDWIETKDQDPEGDARLIQLADIGDGEYLDRSSRFLTMQKAAELKCTFLKSGDLLVARMPDPLGRACVFPGDQRPSVAAVDICIIRPDTLAVDVQWLKWAVNAPVFRSQIARYVSGTTRERISRKNLEKLPLRLPSLPEQRRIAAILDKADAVRRKRRETLDLADQFLRSAFLDMFGDPVTNPKGWPAMKLGDCLARKPQLGTIAKADGEGGVPVVRVGDLGQMWVPSSLPTRVALDQSDIERYRVEPGDFLLARAIGSEAHLGKASVVSVDSLPDCDVVFDSHVMRLRLDELRLSHVFLWHWLKSPGGRALFMRNAGRTAVQFNINATQIARIPIPVPPEALQVRFAEMARVVGGADVAAATATCQCEKLLGAVSYQAFRAEL
jgi:type I restriction enzyme S subunit